MPYIARRRMKHGDGFLEDGDVIADFEQWPSTNRHYLLEKGDVQYREAPAPIAKPKPKADAGDAATPASAPARRKTTRKSPTTRKEARK